MRITTAAVVICAVVTNACFTMRTVTLDDLQSHPAARVWVTNADQTKVLVDGPQVFRGKLVGFVDGKYRELSPAELQLMHVRKVAVARTLTLVGSSILAAATVAVIVSGGENHFDPCAGDEDCSGELRSGETKTPRW